MGHRTGPLPANMWRGIEFPSSNNGVAPSKGCQTSPYTEPWLARPDLASAGHPQGWQHCATWNG